MTNKGQAHYMKLMVLRLLLLLLAFARRITPWARLGQPGKHKHAREKRCDLKPILLIRR